MLQTGLVIHRRGNKATELGQKCADHHYQLILTLLLCIKFFSLIKPTTTVSWIMSRPFEPDPSMNSRRGCFTPQRRVNTSGLCYNCTRFYDTRILWCLNDTSLGQKGINSVRRGLKFSFDLFPRPLWTSGSEVQTN